MSAVGGPALTLRFELHLCDATLYEQIAELWQSSPTLTLPSGLLLQQAVPGEALAFT